MQQLHFHDGVTIRCSVSNCEGWTCQPLGRLSYLILAQWWAELQHSVNGNCMGTLVSLSDIWAIRAWIDDTSDVTSRRLKLRCRCGATCHASSMTRGALQGLLEMVTSSGVRWQTGADSICTMASVLTRGCFKKIRSVLSSPLPHGTRQVERAHMPVLYLNVFGFCLGFISQTGYLQ